MENKQSEINPYITDDIEKILSAEGIEIDETLRLYLTEIQNIPLIPLEEDEQLLQNLDDQKTRNKLFESYVRFVVMIAKEYTGSMNLTDLIKNGFFGLLVAVKTFHCIKNISFSEYAEKFIRHKISTAIEHYEEHIRVSISTMNTIERSMDENRNITVKKLAEVLKHKEFDARQIDAIYRFCKKCSINIISSADPYVTDIEKIVLAEGIKISGLLREEFTAINTVPPLTPEEEKHLLQNLVDGENVCLTLFRKYWRFVIIIAKDYVDSKNKLAILGGVGNRGLAKAIEGFDSTKDMKFPVFAEWVIRQEIIRQIEHDKNN